MIEFGKTLRAAREAKGMTIGQLAEITRMAPTTIRELEDENFTRIAAPIYGRGFVKLYCEAVGLEKKPFVDEFMEIYNGNRDPDIRERPLAEPSADESETPDLVVAPEPPPPPASVLPPPEPAVPETALDLFNQEQTAAPSAEGDILSTAAEPPPVRQSIPPPVQEEEPPPLSRYAAPVRQASPPIDSRAFLRLGILAIAALALLSLAVFGIRAVYRATTRPANGTTQDALPAAAHVEPAAVPAKPAAQARSVTTDRTPARTPKKVPSLYVD